MPIPHHPLANLILAGPRAGFNTVEGEATDLQKAGQKLEDKLGGS